MAVRSYIPQPHHFPCYPHCVLCACGSAFSANPCTIDLPVHWPQISNTSSSSCLGPFQLLLFLPRSFSQKAGFLPLFLQDFHQCHLIIESFPDYSIKSGNSAILSLYREPAQCILSQTVASDPLSSSVTEVSSLHLSLISYEVGINIVSVG